MSETREFPTLEVVTAITGRVCCDIGGVYEVLGFLLGDELMTHQLPAASRAAEAGALAQHPWLAELGAESVTPETVHEWAAGILDRHGPTVTLTALQGADWRAGNALQDLVDMVGEKKIITVVVDDDAG